MTGVFLVYATAPKMEGALVATDSNPVGHALQERARCYASRSERISNNRDRNKRVTDVRKHDELRYGLGFDSSPLRGK